VVRPRKELAIDIRARAIEETIRFLDKHEAAELTMAAIATAVGCRAPALYHHFHNRDALLRAVHDAGFVMLHETKLAVAARAGGDAFARLRGGGIAYLRFAIENPALYKLMFAPPAVIGLGDNPFTDDLGLRSSIFLRRSVLDCQAAGYLRGYDADHVAFTLWAAVHGAASLMLQSRVPLSLPQERLIAMTVDTIMSFIGATGQTPADVETAAQGKA
jgi:AcrR family transcriptional regulator